MIGTHLSDRYEVVAELGRGGMGVVYRGHDPHLRREVAIKVLALASFSEDAETRFRREAQLVAQLDHPAIVPIYDFGRHEDSLFYVMPVAEGKNVQELNREGGLALGEAMEIVAQVAEGLDHSHLHGVIHRDVKPENIMVSRGDGRVRARIMDFGLALDVGVSRLTKTGNLPGTLAYLSPEQILSVEIDGRSDLYSLGTILYECLTGEPPFSGSRYAMLYQIVHENPPRLAGRGIGRHLEETIFRCLAKEPDDRPARGNDLAVLLRTYAEELDRDTLNRAVTFYRTSGLSSRRRVVQPMVGREKELALLCRHLEAAMAGECQLVLIGGEVGIGKTRLLAEFEVQARARGIRVLRGRFSDPETDFPFQGFGEIIQDFFRAHDREGSSSRDSAPHRSSSRDSAEGSGVAVPDLGDLWPDLRTVFPALSEVPQLRELGETAGGEPSRRVETANRSHRAHVFELLARTLTRLAAGRPMVFILEHLQATEVSIAALQYVVRRLGPAPFLFAGTYRREEVSRPHPLMRMIKGFQDDPRFGSLLLDPLSADQLRDLVCMLVGSPRLSGDLVENLYEATEGNPYFTRELVRSLVDTGEVTQDETGIWTLSGEAAILPDTLPETIQQAVETRVERLPAKLRQILSTASVLGRTFELLDLEALLEAAGERTADLDEALDLLIHEDLLTEDKRSRGDRLTFSSGIVRDVLHGQLSRRRRRSLHRLHAEQLERRLSSRRERAYPRLVHHFASGDVSDKTVRYALELARKPIDVFGAEVVLRATGTALEFVEDEEVDSAAEGELRSWLALALRAVGRPEEAMKEAARAVQALERSDDLSLEAAEAALIAAETAWQARKIGETDRWVDEGIGLARRGGAEAVLRKLLTLGATVANLRGEHDKARTRWEETERLRAAPEPEEKVPRGGTLITAVPMRPTTLDLGTVPTVEELEVLSNVFETLIRADAEGHLRPLLCADWESSPNGKTFRLTLRPEVRFSDGQPLSGRDVKRSLESSAVRALRARDTLPAACSAIAGLEAFLAGEAGDLAGLTVQDDLVIDFHLSEPLPIFPALLTDVSTSIHRRDRERLIGTGPFTIDSQDRDRIVLKRNPSYWLRLPPALEAVEFRTSLDASGMAAGLRSGELDLGRDLAPEDLEAALRDPRLRAGFMEATRQNVFFVAFNRAGPATSDPAVRRALFDVVRVQDIVWRTLGRLAYPASCLIPPGILGHDPGRRRSTISRRDARELLASTGAELPIRLRASLLPLLGDRYGSLTRALLEEWEAIGVEVTIETTSMESHIARAKDSAGIDLWIGRWMADYADPDNFTHGLFHSIWGYLPGFLGSAEGDRLVERARYEVRSGTRQMLYRRFEGLLAAERAVLPLFHEIDYRIAGPRVRGLRLDSIPPFVNYSELGKAPAEEAITEPERDGGVLRVPLRSRVDHIDPSHAHVLGSAEVVSNVFETLTRIDEGARIVPWLATEFRSEARGRRFRFRLRRHVRFHDGRRLTVRDIRYSFESLLRHGPRGLADVVLLAIRGATEFRNGLARELAGLEIVSPHELVIELEEPLPFFPALLTSPTTAVRPENTACRTGSWRDGCVGTGPFRVVHVEPGNRIELEAHPQYWRRSLPRRDHLVFELGVSPQRAAEELRDRRFAVVTGLDPAEVERLWKEPDFLAGYRETPGFSTCLLAFNTQAKPFLDVTLRRALVRSLNIEAAVRTTLGKVAQPARSLVPPGLLGHEPEVRPGSGDSGDLKSLKGLRLRTSLSPVFQGPYQRFWSTLVEELRRSGVGIEVLRAPPSQIPELLTAGQLDLAVVRWVADYPDTDSLFSLFHSSGALGPLVGDAEIDRLYEQARRELDPALRHSLYRDLERRLTLRHRTLPLFHEQTYRFVRPDVRGLQLRFGWPEVAYEELTLKL